MDRKVPIGIMLSIILQTAAILIWATRIDSRVGTLERDNSYQDQKIDKLEVIAGRVSVMEERQLNTIGRLDIQTKTMQEILAIVSKQQGK